MRNTVTTLPRRRHSPMRAYDNLHPAARRWLHQAALPWSAASLNRLWVRAMNETNGDIQAALARLSRAEARSLKRDAPGVWGQGYPPGTP